MNFDTMQFQEIINDKNDIIIAGHVNPDGDAIGACLAMAISMKLLDKNPIVLLENYSDKYNFLPGMEYIYKGDWNEVKGDVFICLDCASKDRLGRAAEIFDNTPVTINFDHHISNTSFAMHNDVEIKASSTCEAVYKTINNMLPIDRSIATALYVGILFDTGGFRHNTTTSDTIEIIANLMRCGVDFSEVQRNILHYHTLPEAKAFAIAIGNMKLVEGEKIAVSYLSQNDLIEANANYSDLDGIVEYMLNVEKVCVSVLFTERENNIVKASLRSLDLNVERVAALFGGGGHKNAAGASINDSLKPAMDKVLFEIKKEMGIDG